MELRVQAEIEPAVMHALYRYQVSMQYSSVGSAVVHILVRFLSERGYF